jgi:hypothetical protein
MEHSFAKQVGAAHRDWQCPCCWKILALLPIWAYVRRSKTDGGPPLQSGCWREISLKRLKSAPDEWFLPRPLPLSRMGRTIDPARLLFRLVRTANQTRTSALG